jgi:hypothetical protein
MNDYELELENTIRRLIALHDAAREGSAEYRMVIRQLTGLRDSSELAGLIMDIFQSADLPRYDGVSFSLGAE